MPVRETIKAMELDLAKAADLIDVSVGLVLKKVVFDLGRGIIKRTPVDTGTARANWAATQGGTPAPPTRKFSGGKRAAGDQARGTMNQLVFGDPYSSYFWSNSLPYIEALEFGHSTQAPEGMVRLSMTEVEARFNEFIEEATSEAGL